MVCVSFHVIDGVDKGRSFLNLATPVTIGREEGNVVRLNDERVSRFHAKVQEDQSEVVLTDLDSTNGTFVNGESIQLRLLRPGDRIHVGRSTLVFGTLEEIAASLKANPSAGRSPGAMALLRMIEGGEPVPGAATDYPGSDSEWLPEAEGLYDVFEREPPPLPNRLTPAQAAQLSEVLDFLHRSLVIATDAVHIPAQRDEAVLPTHNWLQIQAVLARLAYYSRQVGEPEE